MVLADGYRLLQANYSGLLQSTYSSTTTPNSDDGATSANMERLTVSDQLQDILSNTVSLFRPYFSWRDITSGPDAAIKMNQLLVTNRELLTSDTKINKPNLSTTDEDTTRMKSDHLDSTERSETAQCHKDCPFFTHAYSNTENSSYCHLYQTVVGGGLATSNLTPCLLHSPFVILASRQVTIEEFMELLKNITRSRSIELLCSFYTMAECSCYLWARYNYTGVFLHRAKRGNLPPFKVCMLHIHVRKLIKQPTSTIFQSNPTTHRGLECAFRSIFPLFGKLPIHDDTHDAGA